ncbi:MAG: hypothetical protein EZS28_044981 [Streblomastix strix]|uniref:Transposase n=1 Tax=Streblomastix strix TaxID=222440 RepID=A0A5J4TNN0_9EUKA|nr:MAG: hypothetical protein EZS28_044981 [Streblomastix strix]
MSKYKPEFKAQIVGLYNQGQGVTYLSKTYEITPSLIYRWINDAKENKTVDNFDDEQMVPIAEYNKVKREHEKVKKEIEIWKAALELINKKIKVMISRQHTFCFDYD